MQTQAPSSKYNICTLIYNSEITGCDPGWTYFDHTEMCYKHEQTKMRWQDACKSIPFKTLASVHDKTTNDFLFNLSGGSDNYWIGGYRDDLGTWHWADGSRWTGYSNWAPGEPNNWAQNENYLSVKGGNWNDFYSAGTLGYICQQQRNNIPPGKTKPWTLFQSEEKMKEY